MGGAKNRRDAVRSFYDENLKALEFGSTVADVILVPLLTLSLIGVIDIPGPTARDIVGLFAFIDVTSTAILIVAGYVGQAPRIVCAACTGAMVATVSFWTCEDCGAKLKPKKIATAGGK